MESNSHGEHIRETGSLAAVVTKNEVTNLHEMDRVQAIEHLGSHEQTRLE